MSEVQVKVSARGVAINCFVARVPELVSKALDTESFRKTVTEDIAKALSMPVDDCGYLFNKARRATERSGKFDDVDFGAAKRAEPIVKATAPAADPDTVAGTVVASTDSGKREDLNSWTVMLIEGGKVAKAYTYANQGVAKSQFGARQKKGGDWKLIQGMGPEVGQDYVLEAGEAEVAQ